MTPQLRLVLALVKKHTTWPSRVSLGTSTGNGGFTSAIKDQLLNAYTTAAHDDLSRQNNFSQNIALSGTRVFVI